MTLWCVFCSVLTCVQKQGEVNSTVNLRDLAWLLLCTTQVMVLLGRVMEDDVVRTNFETKLGLPKGVFEGFMEAVKQAAPLGREGTTEEVAQAVVFLASDEGKQDLFKGKAK